MTIQEAIDQLERLKKEHGPRVPVFFDCPHCAQSFTPGVVVTKAVHLAAERPEGTEKGR
jgi:hypothetical protein